MNGPLLESGTLPIGLVVDGVHHRTFVLRPPTVQDNIDAINEVGSANPVELSAAIFARQLVSVGTLVQANMLPPQAGATPISTDLLRRMHPGDFNEIERASARLEKKLLLGADSSGGGRTAESRLPATASAPSTP
jgi:hypothetical protein